MRKIVFVVATILIITVIGMLAYIHQASGTIPSFSLPSFSSAPPITYSVSFPDRRGVINIEKDNEKNFNDYVIQFNLNKVTYLVLPQGNRVIQIKGFQHIEFILDNNFPLFTQIDYVSRVDKKGQPQEAIVYSYDPATKSLSIKLFLSIAEIDKEQTINLGRRISSSFLRGVYLATYELSAEKMSYADFINAYDLIENDLYVNNKVFIKVFTQQNVNQ